MPQFSVVIPCRNAAAWLGRALASVAQQTTPAVEVIVVDDGSTDESAGIALRAGAIVTRTEGVGGAAARNIGIERAAADWVAFLDADDIWYGDHLERAAALVGGTDDVGLLSWCDHVSPDAQERITRRENPWPIREPTAGLSDVDFIRVLAEHPSFPGMSACFARRDRLAEIGGLDETQPRRHDFEMFLRLVHGRTWAYDPVASGAYRAMTPGSISRNIPEREYYNLRALLLNKDRYSGPEHREHLERLLAWAARRSMSAAITDGDWEHLELAKPMAWPYLSRGDRLLFSVATRVPVVFAVANRARRVLRKRRASRGAAL